MKWFWALWRRANGLDEVHQRLEDFYEVVIYERKAGGYRAHGYFDRSDGEGIYRDGTSMMDALVRLLMAQHERMKNNAED